MLYLRKRLFSGIFRKIRSYFPEDFRKIRSYFPEDFRKIRSYTATLLYYSTFYYITTPTTNRLTLLRIGLLNDITTFRAAIAAKILTWITTFY